MDKKYNIYLKGSLFEEDNSVQGLFCIKTDKDEIPVKIGISRSLLKSWKLNDDASWGNVLIALRFLMAELMFLSDSVRDYVFLPDKYLHSFRDGAKGFNLLKTSLEEQISVL